MKGLKLADLLSRATAYEAWRAPLDEKLRTATMWAGPAIVVGLLLILALQPSLARSASRSLQVGRSGGSDVVLYRLSQLGVLVDVLALGLYVLLLAETDNFQQGAAKWHKAAMGEVIVGTANAFLLASAVAAVIVAVVLAVVVVTVALAALAGIGSSDS